MRKHLWDLRAKRNISLRGLEIKSGVPRSSINSIENGKQMPRIDTVYMLAKGLAIPPGKLLLILAKDEEFSQ